MGLFVFPTHQDIGGGGIGSTVGEPMWQMLNRMYCKPGDGFVWNGFTPTSGTGLSWYVQGGNSWAVCGGYVCNLTANYSLSALLTNNTTNYVWLGVKATDTGHGYRATEANIYVTTTTTPPAGVTFYLRLFKLVVSNNIVTSYTVVKPTLINNITTPVW